MRANLANGKTQTLRPGEQSLQLSSNVRAVILDVGGQVSVRLPRGFSHAGFQIEKWTDGKGKSAEIVRVVADDLELTVLLYASGMARVELRRVED